MANFDKDMIKEAINTSEDLIGDLIHNTNLERKIEDALRQAFLRGVIYGKNLTKG